MSLLVGHLARVDLRRRAARECDAKSRDDEMEGFHSVRRFVSHEGPGRALAIGGADCLCAVAVVFYQLPQALFGDSKLLGPVCDFLILGEIDFAWVVWFSLAGVVAHDGSGLRADRCSC